MKMGKIALLVGIDAELGEWVNQLRTIQKYDPVILGMIVGLEFSQLILESYHVGWPAKIENFDPEKFSRGSSR